LMTCRASSASGWAVLHGSSRYGGGYPLESMRNHFLIFSEYGKQKGPGLVSLPVPKSNSICHSPSHLPHVPCCQLIPLHPADEHRQRSLRER
jgi:hypothetical protein